MTIRKMILKAMKKRDVTDYELAKVIGAHRLDIATWLAESDKTLTFDMVMGMCDHLKIKLCAEHKVGYEWKRVLLKG